MTGGPLVAHLLGVRGSTPCPGCEFSEVGGHTSCVAVEPGTGSDRWLVLDAGTGFRDLGGLLGGGPLDADVVLTHLHWDHVQGLPFLPAADHPGARVDVWVPVPDPAGDPLGLVSRSLSPPSFPISPGELRGRWRFHALVPGGPRAAPPGVSTVQVPHKGGTTLAIRVDRGDGAVAYVPDHAAGTATPAESGRLVDLAAGVDVLLHGAPFLEAERSVADAYGHSTAVDAVRVASGCGARRLVLVHHSPDRTDSDVACVLDEAEAERDRRAHGLEVRLGRQGDEVRVEAAKIGT